MERTARADHRLAEIVRLAEANGVRLDYVSRRVLDVQSGWGIHQGVVALGASLPSLTMNDLPDISSRRGETPLYVVLDGIEDPHNLGAILRTCYATGVHAVIARSRRAVGLTPAAVKAAAGAAEYVPLIEVANIAQSIEALKKNGVWTVGLDGSARESYLSVDYKPPTAIVVGAEGQGISDLVKKRCDLLASIPVKGKIASLNASVATGVVLYEIMRQRTEH
jgi:23S rRNA (guanosine2251-2'-O)-methyltransferase